MRSRLMIALAALTLCLTLAPSPARAIEEEVRLRIFNQQSYDLLLESVRVVGCDGEEVFIEPPEDIEYYGFSRISWQGSCDIHLTWSIRYFTGLTITLDYDAETGEIIARSQSNEFYPTLVGPRCEDGVCSYRLLIWNAESIWD